MPFELSLTIGEIGEKRLIREFVRPFFDGDHDQQVIGHDCAIVGVPDGYEALVSTDRVPADLIAFRLGLIDYRLLGRYLAVLNLSDIAASGGSPVGLLLNMGLPGSLSFADFRKICAGFKKVTEDHSARVLGGDITSASELSLSATSIGIVPRGKALRRSGAHPGDVIFTSRPFGLTPAAFAYFLTLKEPKELAHWRETFVQQFSSLFPLIDFGRHLSTSSNCSSCMDNTDGYSDAFHEIAEESRVALVIEYERLHIPRAVSDVALLLGVDPIELALGPGADFSLVGTTRDLLFTDTAAGHPGVQIVGRVEEGTGVFLQKGLKRDLLQNKGWNYFQNGG